jgi:hypothetical protein
MNRIMHLYLESYIHIWMLPVSGVPVSPLKHLPTYLPRCQHVSSAMIHNGTDTRRPQAANPKPCMRVPPKHTLTLTQYLPEIEQARRIQCVCGQGQISRVRPGASNGQEEVGCRSSSMQGRSVRPGAVHTNLVSVRLLTPPPLIASPPPSPFPSPSLSLSPPSLSLFLPLPPSLSLHPSILSHPRPRPTHMLTHAGETFEQRRPSRISILWRWLLPCWTPSIRIRIVWNRQARPR